MAIQNSVQAMIDNLVIVVLKIHFYYIQDPYLQEDLKQEGYLKAYEILEKGNYDPSKPLRTFLYTVIRNAMSNYLYHNNKEEHDNLDMIEDINWQMYKGVSRDDYWRFKVLRYDDDTNLEYNLDLRTVKEICDKYKCFGDYTASSLIKLKQMGIYDGKLLQETQSPDPIILECITGQIIWKNIKNN